MSFLYQLLPQALKRPLGKIFGRRMLPGWLNRDWRVAHEWPPRAMSLPLSSEALKRMLRLQLFKTSVPVLLRYEDRNAMAHSVENRVPFLYSPLVDYLAGLPEDLFIDRHGTTKNLLRRAMDGILPESIVRRRDKIGFSTPENRWLHGNKARIRSLLNSNQLAGTPIDGPGLSKALDRLEETGGVFSGAIWRSTNLLLWGKAFRVSF
jgi:asparagine synthase (glutamine-hydrolysing)